MQYKYKCDQCDPPKYWDTLAKLRGHERKVHKEEKGASGNDESASGAQTLEIKAPAKKAPAPAAQGYHHIECGAALSKGQTTCPDCGEKIDWSDIE
ncbi:hypothetical protein ES708_11986 [subsurface metagenome]